MSRLYHRSRVALLLVATCPVAVRAQEPTPFPESPPPTAEAFRVLDALPEGPRITPFLLHQLDRAWLQDEARRARFDSVRSEAALRALQAELRGRLLRTIGGLPEERSPLNARIVARIPADGYRIEKLVFESLPELHVTALVYVPEGAGQRPAVLLACGHSPLGKAYPAYQEIAARLARRGYVVLCWDPVGQGERSQFWDAARGRSRYNLVCGEHAVLGNLAALAGLGLGRYMVWDGMRAVDYLLTRPDVDGARLAITGTSGGGFQSLWIGALDERVRVVLPSCFPTALPMRMANRIFEDPDSDPEQDPFGLVSEGIDHAGLLLLVAPRPAHVAAAVKDFFPIEGTRKTLREVKAVLRRLGLHERLALSEGYHEHRYSTENQEAAFSFLDRWLELPVRRALEAVSTRPPESLRCTRSGQVRVDLAGRSLVDIIREEGGARRERTAWRLQPAYRAPGATDVRALRVRPWDGRRVDGVLAWESRGTSRSGDVAIDRYRLYHGDRLVLPAVHVHRAGAEAGGHLPLVLDFGLAGKAGPADWPSLLGHLGAGREVLSFDPRGLGETRLRYRATSVDDPELAPPDEEAAYASPVSGVLANHVYNALLLGRPYLFDLVEDVEIAARFARERLGARELLVSGRGEAGVVAAAAADVLEEITAVPAPGEAAATLDWWRETLDKGRESWPIQLLLPNGAALVPSRGSRPAPPARAGRGFEGGTP